MQNNNSELYSPRTCSITILALSPPDLGSWRCRVHHTASNQFQEAIMEVRENVKDINVRLPDNVRPSRFVKKSKYFLFSVKLKMSGTRCS